jgi:uncharacterized protein
MPVPRADSDRCLREVDLKSRTPAFGERVADGFAERDTGAWRCRVMAKMPSNVAEFLSGRRFAVAGVSRNPQQAANLIFRKLRGSGFEVFPVNPNAAEVEGVLCYPNLTSVSGSLDGVVIATHPRNALEIVGQCVERNVPQVWFHRAFGEGSVSENAARACHGRGIKCIVGGCPLMYCEPVDFGHRCMRWLLKFGGKVPG